MKIDVQNGNTFAWTAESRFAIYYAPSRTSPWWEAGCNWLARDPETGATLTPPEIAALTARSQDVARLSRAPQRYGWHGTLVAPARCAEGVTPDDVIRRTRAWAQRQHPFDLAVEPAALERFVALRPASAQGKAAMQALAADALHECVSLCAMPGEAEQQRRIKANNLNARQQALLARWGYPYVMDEFRFHMTLSDAIEPDEREILVDWWRARTATLGPLPIDGAALFLEPAPGEPFVLVERLPFLSFVASGGTQ